MSDPWQNSDHVDNFRKLAGYSPRVIIMDELATPEETMTLARNIHRVELGDADYSPLERPLALNIREAREGGFIIYQSCARPAEPSPLVALSDDAALLAWLKGHLAAMAEVRCPSPPKKRATKK